MNAAKSTPSAIRFWRGTFLLFAVSSLSSMAGMSIGAGVFMLGSIVALAAGWQTGRREDLRAACCNAWGAVTLAFFTVCFLSLTLSYFFPPLGWPFHGFGEMGKFHHFLYPPLIALAFLRTEPSLERHSFWNWWAGAGIVCFCLAFAQFFGAYLFPEPWLANRFFRVAGTGGHFHGQGLMYFHLSFAACLSFVAAAGLARCFFPLPDDSQRRRAFWAFVACSGCASVYFSFSRIGLAGLVALIMTLGFLKNWRAGLGASVFCAVSGSFLWVAMPSLSLRFVQGGSYNEERYIMWRSAWEMFLERPFFGLGFGRSGEFSSEFAKHFLGHYPAFASHAHDNVLDLLASIGGVGLLAFLAWWAVLFYWAIRLFRQSPEGEKWLPAAALAGFVAFHVNGLTQVNFWDGKSEHTLMLWVGVVLALELRRRSPAFRTLR